MAILIELRSLKVFMNGGSNINNARYEDDIVFIADTERKLKNLQNRVL